MVLPRLENYVRQCVTTVATQDRSSPARSLAPTMLLSTCNNRATIGPGSLSRLSRIAFVKNSISFALCLFCGIGCLGAAGQVPALEGIDELARRGQFPKIVERCNQLIQENPKDAKAYLMRGWAEERLWNIPEAFNNLNSSLRLNPANPRGYLYRARAFMKLGRYKECIADLDTAIKMSPTADPEPYYLRAWVTLS